MTYLLDTNVMAEVRKGDRCDRRVARWFDSVSSHELFVSALVLGEIRKGIEAVRPRDPVKAAAIERWLGRLEADHADRIVPIDPAIADEWGRMAARRPLSVVDGLLAATAKARDLVLVTRNATDVAGTGCRVLNPWSSPNRPRLA